MPTLPFPVAIAQLQLAVDGAVGPPTERAEVLAWIETDAFGATCAAAHVPARWLAWHLHALIKDAAKLHKARLWQALQARKRELHQARVRELELVRARVQGLEGLSAVVARDGWRVFEDKCL